MKSFVYILKDDKCRFYVGSTNDIDRRLYQHNKGFTQTTKRMSVPVLVLKQEYETLQIARKVEKKIKKLKRKEYIEKMVRDGYIKIKP